MKYRILLALTVMASGRAMTLAFVGRAGDGGVGDPPEAWLMPLIGDAAIGLTAVLVALLLWRRRGLATWAIAVGWTAIGAFDALAAFIVELSTPWPEFFMLELFGRSMFFAATAMHLLILYLLADPEIRDRLGVTPMASHTQPEAQPA